MAKAKKLNNFNRISKTDLEHDCLLILSNGQILKYIGRPDCYSHESNLFKIIYSPFATVRWTLIPSEKIYDLEIKCLVK
jgi:hypothetical protein